MKTGVLGLKIFKPNKHEGACFSLFVDTLSETLE